MRILVTGGLGFIGSNFISEIFKKYPSYMITNVDAKLLGSNLENLNNVKKNKKYKFIQGNITNKKLIEKEISKSDIVFNFAAESHVDRSISSPKSFIQSNIVGVFNILEAIRKLGKKLIHISTDEVFGSLNKKSAKEEDRFNPSSPYSSSKASAELLITSYVKTYGIKAIITRCTNNFGPRQHAEKLIPRIILFAQQNKKIPIYGSGKAVRDWIFVKDHCNAIIKVSLKGKWGESYNISANNETNNLTIVKKILKILGKPSNMFFHTEDRPGHDFRYSLDSSKIRKTIKWKTEYDFEEALKLTVKWYLENKYIWKNLPPSALKNTPWNVKN
jgi:dTDP-glucose 4,6-dehydratase